MGRFDWIPYGARVPSTSNSLFFQFTSKSDSDCVQLHASPNIFLYSAITGQSRQYATNNFKFCVTLALAPDPGDATGSCFGSSYTSYTVNAKTVVTSTIQT